MTITATITTTGEDVTTWERRTNTPSAAHYDRPAINGIEQTRLRYLIRERAAQAYPGGMPLEPDEDDHLGAPRVTEAIEMAYEQRIATVCDGDTIAWLRGGGVL